MNEGGPLSAQIASVREEMKSRPDGLVRHTKRVLEESLDLAKRWCVDPERVELATWAHDLFRAHKPADLLAMCWERQIPVSQEEEDSPMLLHGPVAAHALREEFGVTDDEVLAAVRDHTLGAPQMSLIGKIVLLADKFEENKRERTPIMKAIRVAARRDLDLALYAWADWRWVENRTRDLASPPVFWEARMAWLPEHHRELNRTHPDRIEDDGWFAAADAIEPPPDRRTLEERREARRLRDEARANAVR